MADASPYKPLSMFVTTFEVSPYPLGPVVFGAVLAVKKCFWPWILRSKAEVFNEKMEAIWTIRLKKRSENGGKLTLVMCLTYSYT